ncbi:unnamed protein product [Dimorphilus gyrociliatus]|uniref:Uncharacterized protein n=1 Tax=Dimorphilus gyrociliatus TaxID=2664684 RepID=A0A7I8VG72_9ANNE|nr:unnamed protein product [Dimorphilus gyrociliatus]
MLSSKLITVLGAILVCSLVFSAATETANENTDLEQCKIFFNKALEIIRSGRDKRQKTYADYGWGGGRFGKKRSSDADFKKRIAHDLLQVGGRFGRDVKNV